MSTRTYRLFALLVVLLLAIGTIFYHFIEKMAWLDAYYFSVTTLSTVGYGDLSAKTAIGKLFTTFYIFSGVGVITSFFAATFRQRAERIKGHREERQKEKRNK